MSHFCDDPIGFIKRLGFKSSTIDGHRVEMHSLTEVMKADEHCYKMTAAKNPKAAIRFIGFRFRPSKSCGCR